MTYRTRRGWMAASAVLLAAARVRAAASAAAASGAGAAASATVTTLTVSAAASLNEAFREIAVLFERRHPGTVLRLNFGASGPLLQQIAQGAPVDVFAAADEETVARGIERRLLLAETRVVFAGNALLLVKPLQGLEVLRGLNDLTRTEVRRIAVGKPGTVPAGRYTQQALAAARLWSALQPKIVPADNVRQVLDYVARGEVEAGFVYRTDAAVMAQRLQVVAEVGGHLPIRYPAAVVRDSPVPAAARDFVAFLTGDAARAALARHGFALP